METPAIEDADFETAITATGFGKFNLLLLLIGIPAGWTSVFETTSMSYVFPAAQCDLNLSIENKGMLNAVTYIGMISSGLIWGFCADTLGRRKLLMFGYLLDGISVLLSGLSQNFWMLVVAKFIGGSIINGPFAALTSYLSEFHSKKYRARVLMVRGLVVTSGNVVLPLTAWAIMPREIDVVLLNGNFRLNSWNIFLFLCALPSLFSSVAFLLMPESPKFLAAMNRPQEALNVLKIVYRMNTGNPKSSFPIASLKHECIGSKEEEIEKPGGSRTNAQMLKDGFQQILPLFCYPYRLKIILVCVIQIGLLMSLNTLRLWFPQMFTAINDYKLLHNDSGASLCEMLEIVEPSESNATCFVNLTNDSVYISSMIVASTSILAFVFATLFINRVGKKILFSILTTGAGLCAMALYFAKNSETVLTLASLFNAQSGVSLNIIYAILVEIFPTTIRTMALSVAMLCGRAAAIFGNLMFPILLKLGCLPPFLLFGLFMIGCSLMSLLLPKTGHNNR